MVTNDWLHRISLCRTQDQFHLHKQLRTCKNDTDYEQLEHNITQSYQAVTIKQQLIPTITYPAQLPVSDRHAEIAKTIQENQVTIIAGETGSGKTTQIPKICLALGLGAKGLIGHTQPRRIAARTVAHRIKEELATDSSNEIATQLVAYQVRFHDSSSKTTAIKIMTDGILLAEIKHDRYLKKYDTIIIDEAHERSLNIDFLLGYLKLLTKKRPDIKIIITSATIDVEKFAQHFNNAPIVEVSGRTYPVEVFYTPIEKNDELDKKIVTIIDDIQHIEHGSQDSRRDILVFCAGEQHIRLISQAIRKAQLKVDTVPLYARLSLQEQNKAFAPSNQRKVILATNVAETSITVPNIGYVIDPGKARISRYSHRSKIQRLPIEAISQASANQRTGRCGRISSGICFRLYDQEDFAKRPEFTEPEILRSNLAAVILKMIELRLGDIRDFPFIDTPDERFINDGYKLLEELQAITPKKNTIALSKIGKAMSHLPIDPRYSRILYAANELQCLDHVLIIISALSIQDPREYPNEHKQAADEKHAAYHDKKSDFITYIHLWQKIEQQRKELSNKEFKHWCAHNFIAFMRVLEWRDVQKQLVQFCKQLQWPISQHIASLDRYTQENIHRALICGLMSNIARLDYQQNYQACRNQNIHIFPSSSQYKKKPKWLVANEFLETSRVYAHSVASILPEWILKSAQHLLKHQYFEPYYDKKTGLVHAYEKTTLYGLVLVEKKAVYFGKIDPQESRNIFIREALVAGKYQTPGRDDARFYQHNTKLIAEIETIEAKKRKRNVLVNDQVLIDFYRDRLPEKIINLASFERWRQQTEKENAQTLFFSRDLLMNYAIEDDIEQFPNELDLQTMTLPLHYNFDSTSEDDGISLQLPLHLLEKCPEHIGDWLVPGLLAEKCTALIKSLPKELRKHCVPISNTITHILPTLQRGNEALHVQLAFQLKRLHGIHITHKDWQLTKLDTYYRLNYQLRDQNNTLIAQDRDLQALKENYQKKVQQSVTNSSAQDYQKQHIHTWNFGDIDHSITYTQQGIHIEAYPYLSDQQEYVNIELADQATDAQRLHQHGLYRLASLTIKESYKYLQKEILNTHKNNTLNLLFVGINHDYLPDIDTLRDHIILSALQQACFTSYPNIRTSHDFEQALIAGRAEWIPLSFEVEKVILTCIKLFKDIYTQLLTLEDDDRKPEMCEDIYYQLEHLFAEGFLFFTDVRSLQQYPRYLQALLHRIDKSDDNIAKDNEAIEKINYVTQEYYDLLNKHGFSKSYFKRSDIKLYRLMFEEWRVSLFAQKYKTSIPISEKRLQKQWQLILQQGYY